MGLIARLLGIQTNRRRSAPQSRRPPPTPVVQQAPVNDGVVKAAADSARRLHDKGQTAAKIGRLNDAVIYYTEAIAISASLSECSDPAFRACFAGILSSSRANLSAVRLALDDPKRQPCPPKQIPAAVSCGACVNSSVKRLYQEGQKAERSARLNEAAIYYTEAVALAASVSNCAECGSTSRGHLDCRILSGSKERLAAVRRALAEDKRQLRAHKQIHIAADSTGHSYETVFAGLLDDQVTWVHISDPYIRFPHQIINFIKFCEMMVKHCAKLQDIVLSTRLEGQEEHQEALAALKCSLLRRNILLSIEYSMTLHDRQIRLSNGWTVKPGRGLDYFKKSERNELGSFDYDLRKCHETTIDFFHQDASTVRLASRN